MTEQLIVTDDGAYKIARKPDGVLITEVEAGGVELSSYFVPDAVLASILVFVSDPETP